MRTIKQIIPRLALTLVLVTGLGLLCPVPASAAETLDQSQPQSQSPKTVGYSDYRRGQIFTAGAYGRLHRVSLRLENWSSTPPADAVLNISVQTVIGGLPSGKQIGSGSIALSAIPYYGSGGDWVDITIYGGAVMHAGTQYALVLQTTIWNAKVNWWFAFQNQYGSTYTRGVMASNYGDGWSVEASNDFTFNTFVIPDVLDQEQARDSMGYVKGSTLGQLFYAGMSGVLDRVTVFLSKTTFPLEVTIETVAASGYPSGTVIGRGSIPAGPNSVGWYDAWFTAPISDAVVTAGTNYAIVIRQSSGVFTWNSLGGRPYFNAPMVAMGPTGWTLALDDYYGVERFAMFRTYVVPSITLFPPPVPLPFPPITPCSSSVCPAAAGNITPSDSTARVTSNVRFQVLPDGTIHGILNFNDLRTGDFVLRGCNTDSAACRVTVTTFACTDQHSITVAGTYTQMGETEREFRLNLSGVRRGVGTFTLKAGAYTYTLAHIGIVDVTCPINVGE